MTDLLDWIHETVDLTNRSLFEQIHGISPEQWRADQDAKIDKIDKLMGRSFRALAEDGICPKCLRPLAEWPLTAPHSVVQCKGAGNGAA